MNSIIKRELKVNFKSFAIWLGVMMFFSGIMAVMFPVVLESAEDMMKMLESMPEAFLSAFGFEAESFNTVTRFYATEGYLFISLMFCIYASILGGGILSKEESEGTSEYLLVKPIERKTVIRSKKKVVLFYILLTALIPLAINIPLFAIMDEVDVVALVMLSILSALAAITFASITMYISVFISKPRKVLSIGMGLVFGSYLIQIISMLSEKLEFVKYISIFEYIDSSPIVNNHEVNFIYIGIMLFIIVATNILSTKSFIAKDINI